VPPYSAQRKDDENKARAKAAVITPADTAANSTPKSPPPVSRRSSLLTAAKGRILGSYNPAAGSKPQRISFAPPPDDTNPPTTSGKFPKDLHSRELFHQSMSDIHELLHRSGVSVSHGNVALAMMKKVSPEGTMALTAKEADIASGIDDLQGSLNDLEELVRGKQGLLQKIIALPQEVLQGWQDDDKWLALQHHANTCGYAPDHQAAQHLSRTSCNHIRRSYDQLNQSQPNDARTTNVDDRKGAATTARASTTTEVSAETHNRRQALLHGTFTTLYTALRSQMSTVEDQEQFLVDLKQVPEESLRQFKDGIVLLETVRNLKLHKATPLQRDHEGLTNKIFNGLRECVSQMTDYPDLLNKLDKDLQATANERTQGTATASPEAQSGHGATAGGVTQAHRQE
jgi:hypothetical protein